MQMGWRLYFQVVGTPNHYMCSLKFFSPQVVGTLKPSITFTSLPLLPLPPAHLPHSQLAPLTPLAPSLFPRSPAHSLSPSPFAHTEVVGTIKPSITYALLPSLPCPQLTSLAPCYPAHSPHSQFAPLLPSSLPSAPCSLDYHLTPCQHTGGGYLKT